MSKAGSLRKSINNIRDYWNGDKLISSNTKFTGICYGLGVLHLVFAVLFFILKYIIIGLISVLGAYIFICSLTNMLRKDKYYAVYRLAFAEVIFICAFLTVNVGFEWGFMLYLFALCPVSFLLTYSMPGLKRTMTKPFLDSMIALGAYIATKSVMEHITPFSEITAHEKVINAVYIVNCTVTFLTVVAFCIMFSMEIRNKEKELESRNAALSDISSVDPLTKLLNRRSMNECLRIAVEQTKKTGELFTLAIGDIDNFKMVNDIHGHNAGDDVLVTVSNTIKENLPDKSILCRWGGEEFLILIRTPETEAVPYIEAVRSAIARAVTTVEKDHGEKTNLEVTMTFGVSQYMHGFTIDQVVSLADTNLYKGKANGKNRVVHSKTLL